MTFDFATARQTMVDSQVRPNDVTEMAIQHAMRAVERERLCPPDKTFLAYADCEVEIAPGRVMMRPRDVAKLLQAAKPRPGDKALVIGSPYSAAVLEAIGLTVTRLDDGDRKSVPPGAFDLVLSEGAVSDVPAAWLAALAVGGRLVAPVRTSRAGKVRLYVRGAEGVGFRDVFEASPPLLPGFEPESAFVF